MVKKLIACLLVVFFAILFFACSSSKYTGPYDDKGGVVKLDVKWSKLEKGESFPWDDKDGFFPHEDNPYGFDKHTKPLAGKKEDSIVHASVAHNRSLLVILENDSVGIVHGKDGFATLKINQGYGSNLNQDYEFYICDPTSSYPYKLISKIDNSEKQQPYKFTDYLDEEVKRIALCKRRNNDTTESGIAQEMFIHTYEWKNYDFFPVYYKAGGQVKPENGLVASSQFWISFLEVYKQIGYKLRQRAMEIADTVQSAI